MKEIERNLNKNFSNLCDWFVDNSVYYLAQNIDLIKSVVFKLHMHDEINIRQYHTVTYLGCLFIETLSGESMALKIINKINSRHRFLHRKNGFLSPPLHRLLCDSLRQPHFDYACSAWYP